MASYEINENAIAYIKEWITEVIFNIDNDMWYCVSLNKQLLK